MSRVLGLGLGLEILVFFTSLVSLVYSLGLGHCQSWWSESWIVMNKSLLVDMVGWLNLKKNIRLARISMQSLWPTTWEDHGPNSYCPVDWTTIYTTSTIPCTVHGPPTPCRGIVFNLSFEKRRQDGALKIFHSRWLGTAFSYLRNFSHFFPPSLSLVY